MACGIRASIRVYMLLFDFLGGIFDKPCKLFGSVKNLIKCECKHMALSCVL